MVRFAPADEMQSEIDRRVNAYFESTGQTTFAGPVFYLKAMVIMLAFVASYLFVILVADSPAEAIGGTLALAGSIILIGLNLAHEGAHCSISRRRWINYLFGSMMDLVGGSQFLWSQKHNVPHHQYTNVFGSDMDLSASWLLRYSPNAPWKPCHRFQHWYSYILYGLLTITWMLHGDYEKFRSGRHGTYELRKPSIGEKVAFYGFKAFYLVYMLIIPSILHPFPYVIGLFVLLHFTVGLTLSLVFQVAHLVPETSFPAADANGELEHARYRHQLQTTANFAADNRLATWWLGGLNHQVEHHLFPGMSHTHFVEVGKIIRTVCRERNVPYIEYGNIIQAVVAHHRFMKTLGQRPITHRPPPDTTCAARDGHQS